MGWNQEGTSAKRAEWGIGSYEPPLLVRTQRHLPHVGLLVAASDIEQASLAHRSKAGTWLPARNMLWGIWL